MADQPFRPEQRLHQASEFSLVFQFRRVIRGRFFDLHWRPRTSGQDGSPRIGLVVPKRLARRAVMRNLMKRITREAFRRQTAVLPKLDLVFRLARKPGGHPDFGGKDPRPSDPLLRQALACDVDELLVAVTARQEESRLKNREIQP